MLTRAITKRAHAHTASKKKVGTIRNLVPVRGKPLDTTAARLIALRSTRNREQVQK